MYVCNGVGEWVLGTNFHYSHYVARPVCLRSTFTKKFHYHDRYYVEEINDDTAAYVHVAACLSSSSMPWYLFFISSARLQTVE